MVQVMTNVAAFVAEFAVELTLGFATLMVLAALILLIVLIRRKPEDVIARLQDDFAGLADKQGQVENVIKDEMTANRKETAHSQQQARQELGAALTSSSESLQQRMVENIRLQKGQLDSFSRQLMAMAKINEERLEAMRQTIASQLRAIQEDNCGPFRKTTPKNWNRCAPPSMKNYRPPWKNAWVSLSSRSVNVWSRSTRDWAKCATWPPAWAT